VVIISSIFWDMASCSPLKFIQHFRGTHSPHLQGQRISQASMLCLPSVFTQASCLAYSSTLKMEATYSSETSVDFQWTTWHYIQGDRTLQIILISTITIQDFLGSYLHGKPQVPLVSLKVHNFEITDVDYNLYIKNYQLLQYNICGSFTVFWIHQGKIKISIILSM
jgi:hypothetical protein